MKQITLVCVLLMCAVFAYGQTPTPTPAPAPTPAVQSNPSNVYAVGVSYNGSASPEAAGTGLYAHLLSDGSGTYAFTVVDAVPISTKPFTVNTNFGVGIAQKILTIGKVPIFIPTSAGISYNGTSTGWSWSTGGMASIKLKGAWSVMPTLRVQKSSVANGTGYQPIIGVLFGWGQ